MKDKILAIDPGNIVSAYTLFDVYDYRIVNQQIRDNEDMLKIIIMSSVEAVVIERIKSYGMAVGASVFETCEWVGRFTQCAISNNKKVEYLSRQEIKKHLCNSMKAKDANIRCALIDKFEPLGGGKIPQVGNKKNPGPLYCTAKDMWSSLAVAVTFTELNK